MPLRMLLYYQNNVAFGGTIHIGPTTWNFHIFSFSKTPFFANASSRLYHFPHILLSLSVFSTMDSETQGTLLTDNGSPNVSIIRRLFDEKDEDRDRVISFHELMEDITLVKSLKDMYHILLRPWSQKKRKEREMMRHMIPYILEHLQNSVYGSLLSEDRAPDLPAIKRLFNDIDLDKDNCISYSELEELISSIKSGIIPYDPSTAATKIMEEPDVNADHLISKEEFPYYFLGSLCLALGLLAEPLIGSVRDFPAAANLFSFFVAFIFVPLGRNARLVVSAIAKAREKKLKTNSLTQSEIYGTTFKNNILGLTVLLSIIYFHRITWDFLTEIDILMVLPVSAIMGCIASFNTIFLVWTAFFAYMLYPLSLILVYVLGKFDWLY
ncbi:sodium/calcium exchanger NCL2-like [Salvia divinorum]|uniref:Sodium/calcium exchanger NCL2-like n=1 Tax=Salvia divinorum TaxID=28513 RepID=A0ABD1IEZ1_SALDI